MIGDILAVIEYIEKHADRLGTISALFDADGKRISGSAELEVEVLPTTSEKLQTQWFYKVKEKKDYVFVYMPLIPSVYVDYGHVADNPNADAKIFRFVGNPMSTFQQGGSPNVEVDFHVIGYRADKFLKQK